MREHYELNWLGKAEMLEWLSSQLKSVSSQPLDVPYSGAGLLVEADNFQAMLQMREQFGGQVKVIFTDPPYNTGKSWFSYLDKFEEPKKGYTKRILEGSPGSLAQLNLVESTRKHSRWLNFMYPRLVLSRELLRDDGAIFLTIDETEVHNLRVILDEIYGSENFVGQVVWQRRTTQSNNAQGISSSVDYVLVYRKTEAFRVGCFPQSIENLARYSNPDNDPRGPWKTASYRNPLSPAERPNLAYDIIQPNTGEVIECGTAAWRRGKTTFYRDLAEGRVYFGQDGLGNVPRLKVFLSEMSGMRPTNHWGSDFAGDTASGSREITDLFGCNICDTPKPTKLILRALQLCSSVEKDYLVLDIFGGSGSTGHAVMRMNAEDGGNRSFVLIQDTTILSEQSLGYREGYRTIFDVMEERIKRVAQKMGLRENLIVTKRL